ncbi:MAG TPA: DoxX family protein [Pseudolysinimonas sp.]|nr:DoxX family protein [Pseudolysinimonas sp.]
MIIAYFVVASILALLALATGLMKIVRPKERLLAMGAPFAWAEDFSANQIRGIGALEVLGAIGVILPMALGIVPVLGPIAALGLALVQVGAFIVHARRGEKPYLNLVVFALAGATAVLGFFALAAG